MPETSESKVVKRFNKAVRYFNFYSELVMFTTSWFCFTLWAMLQRQADTTEANVALGVAVVCRCIIYTLTLTADKNEIISHLSLFVDSLLFEVFRPEVRQALLLQEESNWLDLPIYWILVYIYHFETNEFIFELEQGFASVQRIAHNNVFNDTKLQNQRATKTHPHPVALKHEMVSKKFRYQCVFTILIIIFFIQYLYEKSLDFFFSLYVRLEFSFTFGRISKSPLLKQNYNEPTRNCQPKMKRKNNEHFQTSTYNDLSTVMPESLQYKMSARPKGMCVIINNRDFSCPDLSRRDGTDEDVKKLSYFFKLWHYELKIFENQTDSDMLEELKRVSSLDHRSYDCFVCFILSHGQQESIYGSNGHLVSVSEIQSFFSARQCRSLAQKPKLFFIQACQGGETAQGVNVDTDHGGSWECDVKPVYPVHEHADFLTVFATVPGYIAYRNTTTGSPFISTLLDMMANSPGLSLTDIITKVTHKMDDGFDRKQIPMFKSTLRKQIVLNERPC